MSTDRLLAFSAVLLSLAALVVAIFQTAILREQQHASVWPFLQSQAAVDEPNYTVTLSNFGVGPARILEFDLQAGDRSYAGFRELALEVIDANGGLDSLINFGWYYAEVSPGEVIPAGGSVQLLQILHSQRLSDGVRALIESDAFRMHIRYADVYGNEWDLQDGHVADR